MTLEFKLDQLQSMKPIFAPKISTLLTSNMQHFHFPAYRKKGIQQLTPELNETKTKGYIMYIGHSSWTICSL